MDQDPNILYTHSRSEKVQHFGMEDLFYTRSNSRTSLSDISCTGKRITSPSSGVSGFMARMWKAGHVYWILRIRTWFIQRSLPVFCFTEWRNAQAIRLVVDVGMHLKGWTREQAIEFFSRMKVRVKEAITSEIERYMAYPGQALGYKIGQLKIPWAPFQSREGIGW